jgi:hypothetical protein
MASVSSPRRIRVASADARPSESRPSHSLRRVTASARVRAAPQPPRPRLRAWASPPRVFHVPVPSLSTPLSTPLSPSLSPPLYPPLGETSSTLLSSSSTLLSSSSTPPHVTPPHPRRPSAAPRLPAWRTLCVQARQCAQAGDLLRAGEAVRAGRRPSARRRGSARARPSGAPRPAPAAPPRPTPAPPPTHHPPPAYIVGASPPSPRIRKRPVRARPAQAPHRTSACARAGGCREHGPPIDRAAAAATMDRL